VDRHLLDDDLVFTGPDGAVYGKHDDLDAHRRGVWREREAQWRVVAGHVSSVAARSE
jgi:hypothetical protein